MKQVVFGGFLIIGGILLTTLSLLKLDNGGSGLITTFPYVGMALFVIGWAFGVSGLREDEKKDEDKEETEDEEDEE